MRKFATAIAMVGLIATSNAHAFDPIPDPALTVYWQIPFDGKSRNKQAPSMGLRFDNSSSLPKHGEPYLPRISRKPALLDFQLDDDGLKSFNLWGRNLLPPRMPWLL